MMHEEIPDGELNEIIRVIDSGYGYDFSGYSVASLKRRMVRFSGISDVPVSDFRHRLAVDAGFFSWMLESLTVNVTEMFRDPPFYHMLNEKAIPALATYPHIKIWHAGCSSGEEVFSMAILLHEAGILGKCQVYATDMNAANLNKAETGAISAIRLGEYEANYRAAGGKANFSDYFTVKNDTAFLSDQLRRNIVFSLHNLVSDFVFNEFQLICCRNVLIYFKKGLQNHVIDLFYKSLSPKGFLALGTKESLLFTDHASKFDVVDQKNKIFRLKTNEQKGL